ncbi:MAG: hypothetical protein LAQ69_05465 [Acidobacteriia bacterium]|nr:hypothetical protein [Terriglobia bacterium]
MCHAQSGVCRAAPQLAAELQKAAATPVTNPVATEQNVAPFLELRERYPESLFVHEAYQDAIHRHGIEGHLRELEDQYLALEAQHPGDSMYRYLHLRALVGRGTPAAIQGLREMLQEFPEFAPAHRILAEVYGGASPYRNADAEKAERAKFLAFCPGEALAARPAPPPERSPLFEQAEKLLAANGDPDRIIRMTGQALEDEEWRSQRIRPFDWYTAEYKREVLQEMRARYWQTWSIQVRCHRKAGSPEKAAELLELMEQSAPALRKQPGPAYWNALDMLARLYAEGNQIGQAVQKLNQMRQYLEDHPDPQRAQALQQLRNAILGERI